MDHDNHTSSKLLVVDDVPDNLFLVEAILSEEDGYDLKCVESGQAALTELESSTPDLILLDVMMPEMNGLEVTRRVRQNPELSDIPIILVTAYGELPVDEALEAGADGFIRKPFDIQELVAIVENTLQHSGRDREMLLCV